MKESYRGICNICENEQVFHKNHRSLREGYACDVCRSSLRYRGQAEAVIELFSTEASRTLGELCQEPAFQNTSIYEPGTIGPFRKYFVFFDNYIQSFYWDDVSPGDYRAGVQCQDLEQLTYKDKRFDLVITSDILEHVRHPWQSFSEIFRVLRPGGHHIFSIPVTHPIPHKSVYRVDTRSDEDVYLLERRYHSAPSVDGKSRGKSLVYTDFGQDVVDHLDRIGFETKLWVPKENGTDIHRLVTFVSQKPKSG